VQNEKKTILTLLGIHYGEPWLHLYCIWPWTSSMNQLLRTS